MGDEALKRILMSLEDLDGLDEEHENTITTLIDPLKSLRRIMSKKKKISHISAKATLP